MRLGLYGGSFNPVHCGHVRAAVEAREQLGLDQVRLVVAARPPHKCGAPVAAFGPRLAMVRAAIRGIEGLGADPVESERPGPSYTVETLEHYRDTVPGAELVFILGSEAFAQLSVWHRWRELPGLAELAVLGRGEGDGKRIGEAVLGHWPGARVPKPGLWRLPDGGTVRHVAAPRLDVSSTDIRRRWLQGLSLACLVPDAVAAMLRENAAELRASWR